MFSHIQIGARDLPKMVAFYDAVLGCLGLERIEGEHDSGPPGEGGSAPASIGHRFSSSCLSTACPPPGAMACK